MLNPVNLFRAVLFVAICTIIGALVGYALIGLLIGLIIVLAAQ